MGVAVLVGTGVGDFVGVGVGVGGLVGVGVGVVAVCCASGNLITDGGDDFAVELPAAWEGGVGVPPGAGVAEGESGDSGAPGAAADGGSKGDGDVVGEIGCAVSAGVGAADRMPFEVETGLRKGSATNVDGCPSGSRTASSTTGLGAADCFTSGCSRPEGVDFGLSTSEGIDCSGTLI